MSTGLFFGRSNFSLSSRGMLHFVTPAFLNLRSFFLVINFSNRDNIIPRYANLVKCLKRLPSRRTPDYFPAAHAESGHARPESLYQSDSFILFLFPFRKFFFVLCGEGAYALSVRLAPTVVPSSRVRHLDCVSHGRSRYIL